MPELPWPELRSWSKRRIRLGIDNESSRFPRKFRSLDAVSRYQECRGFNPMILLSRVVLKQQPEIFGCVLLDLPIAFRTNTRQIFT